MNRKKFTGKLTALTLAAALAVGSPIPSAAAEMAPPDAGTEETVSAGILTLVKTEYSALTTDAGFQLDISYPDTAWLTITSFDTSVVTVDSDTAYASIVGAGSTTISIQAVDEATGMVEDGTVNVTVSKAAQDISVNAESFSCRPGESIPVSAAAIGALSYSSSDEGVFTVSTDGVITAKENPTSDSAYLIIDAAETDIYNPAQKTIPVYVKKTSENTGTGTATVPEVTSKPTATPEARKHTPGNSGTVKQKQTITASNMKLIPKQKKSIGAKAMTSLTYKSSNKKVATVTKKGIIKAKKVGTVKITIKAKATAEYKVAKKVITVKVRRGKNKITITKKKFTVGAKNIRIKTSGTAKMTCKSSNPKVATVNKKGKITAKTVGTAKITVTTKKNKSYKKNKKTFTVTVQPETAVVKAPEAASSSSITIKLKEQKNAAGYQVRYSTSPDMKNAVTVSSDAPSIKIKGLAAGTTYYIQSRTYQKSGKKTIYGAWSTAITTSTLPGKPVPTVTPTPKPTETSKYGHWETRHYGEISRIDEEANSVKDWNEKVGYIIVDYQHRNICNACGEDITDEETGSIIGHACESGYHMTETEMGRSEIYPGETYRVWVEDTEPHDGTWHDAEGHYEVNYDSSGYMLCIGEEWGTGTYGTFEYMTHQKYFCHYVIDKPGYWE